MNSSGVLCFFSSLSSFLFCGLSVERVERGIHFRLVCIFVIFTSSLRCTAQETVELTHVQFLVRTYTVAAHTSVTCLSSRSANQMCFSKGEYDFRWSCSRCRKLAVRSNYVVSLLPVHFPMVQNRCSHRNVRNSPLSA